MVFYGVAASTGYQVADKGRIPTRVLAAYQQAHAAPEVLQHARCQALHVGEISLRVAADQVLRSHQKAGWDEGLPLIGGSCLLNVWNHLTRRGGARFAC